MPLVIYSQGLKCLKKGFKVSNSKRRTKRYIENHKKKLNTSDEIIISFIHELYSRSNTLDENRLTEILGKILYPTINEIRVHQRNTIRDAFYMEVQFRTHEIRLRIDGEWQNHWKSYFENDMDDLNYILKNAVYIEVDDVR
jgi:hypothetical protein